VLVSEIELALSGFLFIVLDPTFRSKVHGACLSSLLWYLTPPELCSGTVIFGLVLSPAACFPSGVFHPGSATFFLAGSSSENRWNWFLRVPLRAPPFSSVPSLSSSLTTAPFLFFEKPFCYISHQWPEHKHLAESLVTMTFFIFHFRAV